MRKAANSFILVSSPENEVFCRGNLYVNKFLQETDVKLVGIDAQYTLNVKIFVTLYDVYMCIFCSSLRKHNAVIVHSYY